MAAALEAIQGKYEVLARLGGGGMGETYLVRHRHLEQARVVKVMRPELTGDEDLRARFLREARIASRIEHPRVARLHDFEVAADGTAYLVLEHVPGYSLGELASLGALPAAAVAEIGLTVADALRALHDAGFLHRDVAPDNVMAYLDERGAAVVKLIDLGIAKALTPTTEIAGTRGDAFVGKPLYASPEQIRTEELDPRSDYYSLGAMLYELATGIFPYRYTNLASLVAAHLHAAPLPFEETDPRGRVPPALRATLVRLLDKDPARRLDSPDRLAIELALASGDAGPAALAERVAAAAARFGPRDAASRAGNPPGAAGEREALQRRLDSRFPVAGAASEISMVAPTVIVPERAASAPPAPTASPVPPAPPAPALASGPASTVLATWVGRASGKVPALGEARGRLAAASLLGGLGFVLLFVAVLWLVGRVPQDDPMAAVLHSVPEGLRDALGLDAGYGWKHTLAKSLFSLTAFLPGIAAGAAGAVARRKGWPAWLGALLAALAAFAFLLPYLPPLGRGYRDDRFPLVAVVYLAAGATAGRLGAWLDAALARR